MKNNEIFDTDNCYIKDEYGTVLARLEEDEEGFLIVRRYPVCTIGTYFYILWYLRELGWDVR